MCARLILKPTPQGLSLSARHREGEKLKQDQRPAKTTREHLDAIFNARSVLSFVGEAIGQSREEYSADAHSGVYFILEHVRDELENAGHALTDAIYPAPGDMNVCGVPLSPANEPGMRMAI